MWETFKGGQFPPLNETLAIVGRAPIERPTTLPQKMEQPNHSPGKCEMNQIKRFNSLHNKHTKTDSTHPHQSKTNPDAGSKYTMPGGTQRAKETYSEEKYKQAYVYNGTWHRKIQRPGAEGKGCHNLNPTALRMVLHTQRTGCLVNHHLKKHGCLLMANELKATTLAANHGQWTTKDNVSALLPSISEQAQKFWWLQKLYLLKECTHT